MLSVSFPVIQCCLCSPSVSLFPQCTPLRDRHYHAGSPTRAMARSTPSLYVSFSARFYARSPQSPGPFPLASNTLRAYRFNTSCPSPPSLSSRSLSFTLRLVLRLSPLYLSLHTVSILGFNRWLSQSYARKTTINPSVVVFWLHPPASICSCSSHSCQLFARRPSICTFTASRFFSFVLSYLTTSSPSSHCRIRSARRNHKVYT
ncbi:hypothetical protein EDB92DRAFT_1362189 [Lactarius akahatsu]|uniref:Uncharacterized protein n=1 Tax=Lactarius akahatsu TaxID=416441 RepID=A0AAD4QAT0_9AGAM|nr:hypothetical protein EDB92DRAFT_1362189 [Lactarius akahatsu]